MSDLHVLVIGAGSIGSRHARNLVAAGAAVTVMDPDASRAEAIAGVTARRFDLDDIDGFDGIVISSPTTHHADHLRAALATTARVLVEKPFALASDDLDALVAQAQGRTMVGYNLRLHDPLERVAAVLADGTIGQVVSARLWFGSWLPDWRPGSDYRLGYSARRDLGGGVLFDAIHELDEAIWFLGRDLDVHSAHIARVGPLDIDVEDTVRALLLADGTVPVEISLDYLSRSYRRGAELIGTAATVRYDWATRTLTLEGPTFRDSEVVDTPIDVAYEREAARFLAFIAADVAPPVGADEGAASVRLATRIREVAKWT